MTQAEVYNFLKKNPNKWFTTREVGKKIKNSQSSCAENLRKLYLNNEVYRKIPKTKGNYYLWKFKK